MSLTLFLCGDVMLGRGIDQVMAHPGKPWLHERYVGDAREYVELAVAHSGPIAGPVDFRYVWGDALTELERVRPDFRIVNLETSVTARDSFWPKKDIHYRMHPANVSCLREARIDCAVLANNHVLDFGYQGLSETLETLDAAGIKTAGAGNTMGEAAEPAVLESPAGRVLVYGCADASSGVSAEWAAGKEKAGINFLPNLSDETVAQIKICIAARKRPGDTAVLSIHWGDNWGYEIDESHRQFAHALVDEAAIDVVHGHSSHHAKAMEIYHGKPILFGCGDFIDDYEGISGYEVFRPDLKLMYFLRLDPADRTLISLELVPMQMCRFRLQYAGIADAHWLCELLNREGEKLGARFELTPRNSLELACAGASPSPAKSC